MRSLDQPNYLKRRKGTPRLAPSTAEQPFKNGRSPGPSGKCFTAGGDNVRNASEPYLACI